MKKSKPISGQKSSNYRFSDNEKIRIIEYYLSTGQTKRAVWKKFTGEDQEHGSILTWMRIFGYINPTINRINTMKKGFKPPQDVGDSLNEMVLKERISELEKKLQTAEMKSLAFSKMIDVAEQELKIKIRKKYEFKP